MTYQLYVNSFWPSGPIHRNWNSEGKLAAAADLRRVAELIEQSSEEPTQITIIITQTSAGAQVDPGPGGVAIPPSGFAPIAPVRPELTSRAQFLIGKAKGATAGGVVSDLNNPDTVHQIPVEGTDHDMPQVGFGATSPTAIPAVDPEDGGL